MVWTSKELETAAGPLHCVYGLGAEVSFRMRMRAIRYPDEAFGSRAASDTKEYLQNPFHFFGTVQRVQIVWMGDAVGRRRLQSFATYVEQETVHQL